MIRPLPLLAFIALVAAACTEQGATATAPPSGTTASAFPAADRPVSDIVSPEWSSEAERDAADESGQLVRRLGIAPGMTVADIGAGNGYHTVRLSPVVGREGRVIAQDITPNYLADLRTRVTKAGLGNISFVLGAPDDPKLPAGAVDLALMVHMYHEIEQPYAFLHNLARALKPGARVAVTDLDRSTDRHGTPPALLRCEFEAVGYRQLSSEPLKGDVGYLSVFAAPAALPAPGAIVPCRAR
ncbi:MAG: class I SAM-dependent methyltransferase [Pseudomonadota bacterium]|nr:class I SAM-dependent methyltransferase [Pseudomonadota bacterium]